MDEITFGVKAIIGGILIGLVFGFAALRSNFCLRTALITSDRAERVIQIRIWVIALLVAVFGIQVLIQQFSLDISDSIYQMAEINPLTLIVGGLLFGSGTVLARGCLARHLVLGGSGNIRSWVVALVAGLSAYATARGIFAYQRISLNELMAIQIDPQAMTAYVALCFGIIILLALIYLRKDIFIGEKAVQGLSWGIVIGATIIASFWITGIYAFDEFEPKAAESLRFTLPLGDSIVYLITHTGSAANFSIGLIGGTILGSFLGALTSARLELRSFETPQSTLRYLLGALFMGIGGVMALGCTIGQALVGLSTLSASAPIAILAMMVGGYITNRSFTSQPKSSRANA